MIKTIGTAYKRDDFTHDEFYDYWMNIHAPISREAPGLRGYVVSEVTRRIAGELEVEAFVEQWYDDEDALDRATDIARRPGRVGRRGQLRQDHGNVLDRQAARDHPAADRLTSTLTFAVSRRR